MSTGRLGAGDTAIQSTIVDAKGDLIVATAADTPARLAVGTNDHVLTADSSTATGLKWAAAASGLTYVGASVGFAADKTIANATTTTLNFDNELLDSDAFHDNSTNNSRLTIPSGKAGKYRLSSQLFPLANSSGRREIRFVKNGTVVAGWNMDAFGLMERIDFFFYVNAIVGDYFECTYRQSSGGNLTLYGSNSVGAGVCMFNIDYLGA